MNITTSNKRADGRALSELRPIKVLSGVSPYAEGSAEVQVGATRLFATASVDLSNTEQEELQVKLAMLPRATHVRLKDAELKAAVDKELSGIRELVVRSLYAALPNGGIPGATVTLDVTVICSDGGIATAALAGCWTALAGALDWAYKRGLLKEPISLRAVAAISAGTLGGHPFVDLTAEEASAAEFILNMVFDQEQKVVEVKASRESASQNLSVLVSSLQAGAARVQEIFEAMRQAERG